MKGTKLFQRAGSPLIQGRSRRERPFWTEWLGGTMVALGVWALASLVWGLLDTGTFSGALSGALDVAEESVLGALVAGAVGSAIGVFAGRAWGLVKPWVAGAIVGGILGFGASAYLAWAILMGA